MRVTTIAILYNKNSLDLLQSLLIMSGRHKTHVTYNRVAVAIKTPCYIANIERVGKNYRGMLNRYF